MLVYRLEHKIDKNGPFTYRGAGNKIAEKYNIENLPETLFVDHPSHRQKYRYIFGWDEDKIGSFFYKSSVKAIKEAEYHVVVFDAKEFHVYGDGQMLFVRESATLLRTIEVDELELNEPVKIYSDIEKE